MVDIKYRYFTITVQIALIDGFSAYMAVVGCANFFFAHAVINHSSLVNHQSSITKPSSPFSLIPCILTCSTVLMLYCSNFPARPYLIMDSLNRITRRLAD